MDAKILSPSLGCAALDGKDPANRPIKGQTTHVRRRTAQFPVGSHIVQTHDFYNQQMDTLPRELQLLILEFAAEDKRTARNVILASKAIYQWYEILKVQENCSLFC